MTDTELDPGSGLHYLDNAATTFPRPESVMQLAVKFCASACVNPGRSRYDLAIAAETMLRDARKAVRPFAGRPLPLFEFVAACRQRRGGGVARP